MLEDDGEEPVLPLAAEEVLVDDDVGREEAEAREASARLRIRSDTASVQPSSSRKSFS